MLKKFDKRFGYTFTDYHVKTHANHLYSHVRQKCQGSYISIYNQPSYAHQVSS
ncbi:SPX domain membrane protein [Medicago truncatula]|uniref:SPX domain membrane protein n=1 Tax=Medicago truncatula TaxID=3880 RepID=G7L0H5_MEDTR|nr:SPX domain membrane protein [Medicago truncatula]